MTFNLPRLLEAAVGVALAAQTSLDVFETVVAPGVPQGWFRVAQRVRVVSLPLFRHHASRREGAPRLARGLAPFILTATFTLWMALLLVGYGLIDDALRDDFRPALPGLGEAIYTAGLGLVTTGMSGRDATGIARWVVLVSGVSGLAVMTTVVTYILEVQNGLQRRDAALAKLTTVAGRPPSGIAILETYAAVDCRAELGLFFREWCDWSAGVLQSHTSNPVLAYFRSVSAEMDWPVAIGAVLDAASLYAAFVDGEEIGPAMLLHRNGARLAASLARLYRVEPTRAEPLRPETLAVLEQRLEAAGYRVTRTPAARERFASLQRDYGYRVAKLCEHFGVGEVRLVTAHESYASEYRR